MTMIDIRKSGAIFLNNIINVNNKGGRVMTDKLRNSGLGKFIFPLSYGN
jgi:hypothetical protein